MCGDCVHASGSLKQRARTSSPVFVLFTRLSGREGGREGELLCFSQLVERVIQQRKETQSQSQSQTDRNYRIIGQVKVNQVSQLGQVLFQASVRQTTVAVRVGSRHPVGQIEAPAALVSAVVWTRNGIAMRRPSPNGIA